MPASGQDNSIHGVCCRDRRRLCLHRFGSSAVVGGDDALNVVSYVQTDLSDDGRWLATVSTLRRDNFGVDYRRDGDPTYIRPSSGTVLVIETATGKSRAIFNVSRHAATRPTSVSELARPKRSISVSGPAQSTPPTRIAAR